MTVGAVISDPKTSMEARVTAYGQLVTAPLAFSLPSQNTMAVDDQAYNFIVPKDGKKIIITDIILLGDRSIGVADASVVVYANTTGPDSTVVDETILAVDIAKNGQLVLTGLNLSPVTEGVWINAKSTDSSIGASIYYYYATPV